MYAYHLIIVRNTKIILERVKHSFAALSVSISQSATCVLYIHTLITVDTNTGCNRRTNHKRYALHLLVHQLHSLLGNWIQRVRRTATKAKRNHHIHMSRVDRYLLLEAVRHMSKYTGCFIRRGPFSRAGSLH